MERGSAKIDACSGQGLGQGLTPAKGQGLGQRQGLGPGQGQGCVVAPVVGADDDGGRWRCHHSSTPNTITITGKIAVTSCH